MRVLITGAGGYISSPVLEKMLGDAMPYVEYVVAVDRVGVAPNPDVVLSTKADWVSANLDEVDTSWWDDIINTNAIDTVYYMESIENDNRCESDPMFNDRIQLSDFYFASFLEKRVIIENTPDIRVLYFSTDKIYYGDTFPNEVHDIVLKTNDESLTKDRPYFYTYVAGKAQVEVRLQQTSNIDLRIIRAFAITGPTRNVDCPVPTYVNLALKDELIQLYDEGKQGVAFTHVNDLVAFLTHPNLFNADVKQELTSNVVNFCRVQNYLSVRQLTEKIVNKIESSSTLTGGNNLNIFQEVMQTPQIRNMVRIHQPTIPIEIILEDIIYELDPVNHYVPLIVDDPVINPNDITITGTSEPKSTLSIFFGNGETTGGDVDQDGKFTINYTFEFPTDIYPIEIFATTIDYIQYDTVVLTII